MANRTVKVTLNAQVQDYIAGMSAAAKATRTVGTAAEKLAQQREAFNLLGRAGIAFGVAMGAGIGMAIGKAAEFDKAMSNVNAVTQETTGNLSLLREAALEAGGRTIYTATEAANAIEELGKAGLSTSDILGGALNGALNLAASGQLEVARAAEITATTLKQFGLQGGQAAHVADVLSAGAGKALGSVDDLAQGMKFVGPVAASMGVSLEETTGALALFADQGIIGEQAGTSLRGVLASLTSPSAAAAKEIDNLGINLYDAEGGFAGLSNLAGQLSTAYSNLDDKTRDASLGIIFGNQQVTAARVLFESGGQALARYTSEVDDAGYASRVASDRLDNLAGDVEKLGGAFDNALITSGSSANGVLRFLVQTATEGVEAFNGMPGPVQAASLAVGGLATAATLAGGAFLLGVPKVQAYKQALELMGPGAQRASRALTAVGKGLGFVAGLGAAALVLDKVASSGRAAARGVEETLQVLKNDGVDEVFAGAGGDVTDFASALELLTGDSVDSNMERFGSTLNGIFFGGQLSDQVQDAKQKFDTLGQGLAQLVSGGDADEAAKQFEMIAAAAAEQEISTEELLDLMPAYKEALAGVSNEQDDVAATAFSATEAIDGMADVVAAFNEQQYRSDDALYNFKQSLIDLDEAMGADGFTGTLDLSKQEGIDNNRMLRDLAQATNDASGEYLRLTGDAEGANAILEEGRAKLAEVGEQFGLSGDALQQFIDKYTENPTHLTYQAELIHLAEVQAQINSFIIANDGKTIRFNSTFFGRATGLTPTSAWDNANGGLYSYANGGFGEGIYRGGRPRYKFAEPETGWEAFISGRPGMEAQNTQYALEALSRLGYNGYAGGGGSAVESSGGALTALVDPAFVREVRALAHAHRATLDEVGLSRAASAGSAQRARLGAT